MNGSNGRRTEQTGQAEQAAGQTPLDERAAAFCPRMEQRQQKKHWEFTFCETRPEITLDRLAGSVTVKGLAGSAANLRRRLRAAAGEHVGPCSALLRQKTGFELEAEAARRETEGCFRGKPLTTLNHLVSRPVSRYNSFTI